MSEKSTHPWGDVDQWSIEKVVGQLMVVSIGHHMDGGYVAGDTPDHVASLIATHHIGGICYFPVGITGGLPTKVATHITDCQKAAEIPLLVTIDQEGGLVTRMREPATRWPSAMAQMASGADVETTMRMSGTELADVGVSQVYAPVADVNVEPANPVIGIRSASADPEDVAHFVAAAVNGYRSAGIASCLKHFPGHGDTTVDSHHGMPTVDIDKETWLATEARPFLSGIAAGVEAIMIGHVRAPNLDPSGAPATFSRPIVTGLLRQELGYDGLIVTDALDMKGATMAGYSDPGVAALAAGVDQLLMPADPEATIAAVLAAIDAGELDEAQLRASAKRVLALKHRLGLAEPQPRDIQSSYRDHEKVADRVRTRAIAWRDPAVTARLGGAPVDIVADPLPPSVGRGVEDVPAKLAETLAAHGIDARVTDLDADVRPGADVILLTRDAWRYPEIAERVRSIQPFLAIAARSPYDAALVGEETPMLLAYGDIPGLAASLARVLLSGVALGGLPVGLPGGDGEVRWPAHPPARPVVRPYREEDREDIGRICIRTGASGQDATGTYVDDEILPYIYAYPYLEYAPDLTLVVEVNGTVVGYILGVASVDEFVSWWEKNWTPVVAERFAVGEHRSAAENKIIDKGLNPRVMMAPWRAEHPGEFHVDMLPIVHGLGLGTTLVDQFSDLLASRGVDSLAIGVGSANVGAVAFYRAQGFVPLAQWHNAAGEVGGYTMSRPTRRTP